MFKIRLAFLQAINRVGEQFGQNERVEFALWSLLNLIDATALEKKVFSDIIMIKAADDRDGDDHAKK